MAYTYISWQEPGGGDPEGLLQGAGYRHRGLQPAGAEPAGGGARRGAQGLARQPAALQRGEPEAEPGEAYYTYDTYIYTPNDTY